MGTTKKTIKSKMNFPTQGPFPFDTYDHVPNHDQKFSLISPDLKDGDILSTPQLSGMFGVLGGKDETPALEWSGFPPETKSFVVTCYDPDAPIVSGFWHGAMFHVPASVTSLEADAGNAGFRGYLGAAAPPGHGQHRYIFVVTALATDKIPMVDEYSSPALLHGMMNRAGILGRGFLTGNYGR